MEKMVSIALSGGGIRGAAHIGVLKYLTEVKAVPEVISGTSAGAMVGAFLADGFSAYDIEEIFIRSKFSFDFNYLKFSSALFSIKRLEELLRKNLRSKNFSQLQKKFYVCVTNYLNGRPEYLNSGDLVETILASSAIPIIYQPVKINNTLYVDGGLSRNLPTQPLTNYKFPIIGVHVNPISINPKQINFAQKVDHTVHLALRESLESCASVCKIFIEPEKLVKHSIFDTGHLKQIIAIGYEKAKQECTPQRLINLY